MKLMRRPLAAMTAAVFALATPPALSNTFFVTNCNDAGAGSLRDAASLANTTDVVDLSGLKTTDVGCSASTITLKTGDIAVRQDDLIIVGPGADQLTVTGQTIPASGPPVVEHKRIFTHTGTGQLVIGSLSISHGYLYTSGNAQGGCIYSAGSVQLFKSNVTDCSAISSGGSAYGGAVYTKGKTSLYYSSALRNNVLAPVENKEHGGAISSSGGIAMRYSTVASNSTLCIPGSTNSGFGGGIFVNRGSVYVLSSSISSNTSCYAIGGLAAYDVSSPTAMINSTIANNVAIGGRIAGASINGSTISISNSTVAFNRALQTKGIFSAGLELNSPKVTLNSNILANNVTGADVANDIAISGAGSTPTVKGANNLVFAPESSLPADTIVGSCPLLGNLRDNGGQTYTTALQSRSPAIDTGNNEFDTALPYDQRGLPFNRTSGAAPDIGAYEVDQAETVFTANFEGCP